MSTNDMANGHEFHDLIATAIKEATGSLGRVNVLTAGKTGVGKSTLINSVFRGDLARTGSGKPVTQSITEITRPGHPLTIIDTKGLEVGDYAGTREALETLIQERLGAEDADHHIHVAWVCIAENGDRVEPAEIDLCAMLDAMSIPVVVILTKGRPKNPFAQTVKDLVPCAKAVVSVRAISEFIEELQQSLPPFGLDQLIEVTARLIPEAQRRAYANALSTRNRKALEEKKKQAEKEVVIAVTAAMTVAATPIPFSDAILLVPVQAAMIAKVGSTFGMEVSTSTVSTLVTTVLGASAATLLGRALVNAVLKLIPGAGSVIAATTAGALTKALGDAYIAVLYEFCLNNPGEELDIALISKELKRRVEQLYTAGTATA